MRLKICLLITFQVLIFFIPVVSYAADLSKYAVAQVAYKENNKFTISWKSISPDGMPLPVKTLNSLYRQVGTSFRKSARSIYGSNNEFSKDFGILLRTYYENDSKRYEWTLLRVGGENVLKMPLKALLGNRTSYKVVLDDSDILNIEEEKKGYRSISNDSLIETINKRESTKLIKENPVTKDAKKILEELNKINITQITLNLTPLKDGIFQTIKHNPIAKTVLESENKIQIVENKEIENSLIKLTKSMARVLKCDIKNIKQEIKLKNKNQGYFLLRIPFIRSPFMSGEIRGNKLLNLKRHNIKQSEYQNAAYKILLTERELIKKTNKELTKAYQESLYLKKVANSLKERKTYKKLENLDSLLQKAATLKPNTFRVYKEVNKLTRENKLKKAYSAAISFMNQSKTTRALRKEYIKNLTKKPQP